VIQRQDIADLRDCHHGEPSPPWDLAYILYNKHPIERE
jgi:hypothetical protein